MFFDGRSNESSLDAELGDMDRLCELEVVWSSLEEDPLSVSGPSISSPSISSVSASLAVSTLGDLGDPGECGECGDRKVSSFSIDAELDASDVDDGEDIRI